VWYKFILCCKSRHNYDLTLNRALLCSLVTEKVRTVYKRRHLTRISELRLLNPGAGAISKSSLLSLTLLEKRLLRVSARGPNDKKKRKNNGNRTLRGTRTRNLKIRSLARYHCASRAYVVIGCIIGLDCVGLRPTAIWDSPATSRLVVLRATIAPAGPILLSTVDIIARPAAAPQPYGGRFAPAPTMLGLVVRIHCSPPQPILSTKFAQRAQHSIPTS
jgi:hypothetical protein